jgi:Rps23 Pro-64 3,4-dihydroxylase Tpa1-like proline 4-hydroxylase
LFSASWYLPGDHSLPHTDAVTHADGEQRQVAFVWHLARGWRSEWGGALFWCPGNVYLAPTFNTLVLFTVGPNSYHFVSQVSPYAQGKRLAINGWWTGRTAVPVGPEQAPELLKLDGVAVEVY